MGSNKGNVLRIETPDEKDQRIARLEAENALLRQKIDALSHRLFGKSSEQLDPDQLQLLLQGIEEPKKHQASSDETSAPEEADDAKRKKAKTKNHSRIRGLDTLETEEQIHLPAEYEANPDAYDIIGQEVTELLDYRPARCIRQIITRVKVRPKNDSSQPPILAPAPTRPLVGGLPSFNLVTDLIIGKYADHLPLYRQQGILQRYGLSIPRDTLNHWTLQSLELLVPIAEAIHRETLATDYLQGDETPLRLLAPGTGKTATSYFWVFNYPTGSISYHWSKNRSATNLHNILSTNFSGDLQCDGYGHLPLQTSSTFQQAPGSVSRDHFSSP
ncbi:transposase [Roseibacillus persicicus]|uniref:IS66 family transposase n=1 Tax=Roseibacillus persicicus TaxID=454148 RepID=UPI00398B7226